MSKHKMFAALCKACMVLAFALTLAGYAQAEESYQFILKWGSYGSGDGQFVTPYGVAADSSGNVYVADTGNHRIQKFGLVLSDTVPPSITINSPAAKDYLISDVLTIDWTVTDSGSGVKSSSATLDGQNVQSGQSINLYISWKPYAYSLCRG